MNDFATARRMMVDGQVRPNDVTDLRILGAMQDIPRERFVPPAQAGLAYLDLDVPAGQGRYLLKPMVLAKLISAADIGSGDSVLDVACATGYSSAVLARLAGKVVALDEDKVLALAADETLNGIGANMGATIDVVTGPLVSGWAARVPYDVILINGATGIVPETLCSQLRDGGRLVCVLGGGVASKAMLYRKSGTESAGRPIFDATAPLLPGFEKRPAFAF